MSNPGATTLVSTGMRLAAFAALLCCLAEAQTRRVVLAGNVPGALRAAADWGRVGTDLKLPSMRISLKPSAEKQAALEALLAAQQDPSSPQFHKWLTPETYAARFGASDADIAEVSAWLIGRGLRVTAIARGRNAVSFEGSVPEVEAAFDTEIHRYTVKGEAHFANSSEPSVPANLRARIAAIHGLNDFRLKPRFTASTGDHYLAPDDFATIYDVKPLYAKGITGLGQKVVVVGQTQVNLADIQQFRNTFNLPVKDPHMVLVPGLTDPGVVSADLTEATLDIDWVGAVARDATLLYVYSDYVTDALAYAIDENLAPVISMSYGLCESDLGVSDASIFRSYAQRAAAQGITWVAASGDAGSADCYDSASRAVANLAVDIPASLPEVTGVGGTRFEEGAGAFWNAGNDANRASVLSYIPEIGWNDSSTGTLSSSGGGASSFFGKPIWQTGTPNDGARDVPDIALSASAQHVGYLVYLDNRRYAVGGTSAGAPAFAGMVALLNQSLSSSGLGNVNPRLYALAATAPNVFHDITSGDNIVNPCSPQVIPCTAERVGFSAGAGYDQVTGLGTIDAFNLVSAWGSAGSSKNAVSVSLSTISQGATVTLTAKVAAANGGTPSGSVSFLAGSTVVGTVALSSVTATLTLPAALLAGAGPLTAKYNGDSGFAEFTSTAVFFEIGIAGTVNAASFKPIAAPGMILAVFGGLMAGDTQSAPALPLPTTLAGASATVNDVPCALYYVSPTQINLQVPASISPGPAVLRVTYNGRTATSPLTITASAPGVFMDFETNAPAPDETAKRGQTISLYVTGNGGLDPTVTVGNTPAKLLYWGVPAWSVGVTQINYTVPANVALGRVPVVVTAGGIPSAPLFLTVTQ